MTCDCPELSSTNANDLQLLHLVIQSIIIWKEAMETLKSQAAALFGRSDAEHRAATGGLLSQLYYLLTHPLHASHHIYSSL